MHPCRGLAQAGGGSELTPSQLSPPPDLLRTLKEKSEANRGARKRELEDRYCRRQAELGVGDCGGLRCGAAASRVQHR